MSTFGRTTIGASRNVIFGDAKQVQGPYTLPVAASVVSVTFYAANGGGGAGDVQPVIYDDSGGSPGALVGSGPAKTINPGVVGDGWFECLLTAPVNLAAGSYYIGTIAANAGATNWAEAYDAGSPGGSNRYHWNGDTYADGPTDPFGTDNLIDWDASYYATYHTVEFLDNEDGVNTLTLEDGTVIKLETST